MIRAKGRRSHPRASYHQLEKLTGGEYEIAFAALRFISAGGTFVPADALCSTAKPDYPPEGERQRRSGGLDLPPRELWVVDHLREGKPNKLIARQLEMQENTVRVHVRDILTTHEL